MNKNAESMFTKIYKKQFNDNESISGKGSGTEQTATIIQEIPKLLEELNIKSIVDIPCGDFFWMRNIGMEGINYTGLDIVAHLIEYNNKHYQTDNVQFIHTDLTEDELPKADLLICRDCLVHLSFNDINKALQNIIESQSRYLLTTTFINRDTNKDIQTGGWRTLNYTKAPFNFPEPIKVITEKCTEGDMGFIDKSLGLWLISDLAGL